MKPFYIVFSVLAIQVGAFTQAEVLADKASIVENERTEESLTTITLSESAERRLAIRVVPIELQSIQITQSYPGEVVFPLQEGSNGLPSLASHTPDAIRDLLQKQIEADAAVEKANKQAIFAKSQHEQTRSMLGRKIVSQMEVDKSKLDWEEAEISLSAAKRIRALLGKSAFAQTSANNHFWVKSPIYGGDVDRLDLETNALLNEINSDTLDLIAQPINEYRTANATQGTVDIYFELPSSDNLILGQRVRIDIPLKRKPESSVIPWSAVLFDIHGSQWVYQQIAPFTYTRRFVQVERVAGNKALLIAGPPAGSLIVTEGAAELMGTEFGVGH